MSNVQQETTTSESTAAESAAPGLTAARERRSWAEGTRKAAAAVNRQAKDAGDYSAVQIRAHPFRSVAVALGAGLVLGALFFA